MRLGRRAGTDFKTLRAEVQQVWELHKLLVRKVCVQHWGVKEVLPP